MMLLRMLGSSSMTRTFFLASAISSLRPAVRSAAGDHNRETGSGADCAREADFATVKLHCLLHDRKTQARARAVFDVRSAMKALEHPRLVLQGYPDSPILDLDRGVLVAPAERKSDFAPRRRVLHCVREEVV